MFTVRRIQSKIKLNRKCSSQFTVNQLLNDENKRKTIQKFANLQSIKQLPTSLTRKAAVLIPICIVNSEVSLLYTLRAATLKTHRGQVSFPGGMHDVSDRDLEQTALRETEEELGLFDSDIELWGKGNVIVSRGVTGVLPVIGLIKGELNVDRMRINPHEVTEVFTVPVRLLCDPKKIGYTQFRNSYSVPVFLGGQRRIWGLTAVITNLFLRSFLPRGTYQHHIKYVQSVRTL